MPPATTLIMWDMCNILYILIKILFLISWHQHCISQLQGKGSGSNRMPKENTVPTDIRDKVGDLDPGMESFRTAPLYKGALQREIETVLMHD